MVKNFLASNGDVTNFYAFFHCTDSAQHLWGDKVQQFPTPEKGMVKAQIVRYAP